MTTDVRIKKKEFKKKRVHQFCFDIKNEGEEKIEITKKKNLDKKNLGTNDPTGGEKSIECRVF